MTPQPTAVALTLCDYVLVEEGSRKLSLIGCLTSKTAERFPFLIPSFYACAALTDAQGDGRVEVVVSQLETDTQVYARSTPVHFADRFRVVNVIFSMRHCPFPAPGWYDFSLFVDDESVAQRRLRVVPAGESA